MPRSKSRLAGGLVAVAAALLLASPEYAKKWADRVGVSLEDIPRIKGWGHNTSRILFEDKVAESANDKYVLPHVRSTVTSAMKRAGIADVNGVDAISEVPPSRWDAKDWPASGEASSYRRHSVRISP